MNALLAARANNNPTNNWGWTPLNTASHEGHVECVTSLLAAGANKDQANNLGWTPLDSAAEKGHTEVVAVLEAAAAEFKSTASGSTA